MIERILSELNGNLIAPREHFRPDTPPSWHTNQPSLETSFAQEAWFEPNN